MAGGNVVGMARCGLKPWPHGALKTLFKLPGTLLQS